MNPRFKAAEHSDADALLSMMRGLYEHDASPFDEGSARAALARMLGEESYGLAYLITLGEEVAGYLVLTFGFSLEFGGRDAFVDELFVRAEFPGRGLGSGALRFAEEVCRGRGVRALRLEVERANAAAQAVYRRAGFAAHDRLLMTRRL